VLFWWFSDFGFSRGPGLHGRSGGSNFRVDFSQSSGVAHCFLASSSSELWKGIGSWVT
jgi:hypothetical protein